MLILLNSPFVFSQNIKEDLITINKSFANSNKLSLDVNINMYENYTTSKIYYNQKGAIKKYNDSFVYSFDNSESINTSDYSIIVDGEDKTIVYLPKKSYKKVTTDIYKINFDSLLLYCSNYKFNKLAGNKANYDFVMKSFYPDYERIIIEFNTKTFFIEKIILYCEEDDISIEDEKEKIAKSRIEIQYLNINTKPTINKDDFTYSKYLIRTGNTFTTKPNYNKYKLTVLQLPK